MKLNPSLVLLGLILAITLAETKNDGGYCYSSLGDSYSSCRNEGRYKVGSLDECCSNGNATGYSADTSNMKAVKDFFLRRKQSTCQSCADSFHKSKKWCFAYRNAVEGVCLHMPKLSTLEAVNEIDCCLWYNATGYIETPKWQWSAVYNRWTTPCNKCVRDNFVACFLEFSDIQFVGRKCSNSLPRFAESPDGCCVRPNVTGYAWVAKNSRVISECHPCPVNGGWSAWSAWSPCSTTCGQAGVKRRARWCDSPPPQYNGAKCLGHTEQNEPCDHNPKCQSDVVTTTALSGHVRESWSEWSSFSSCSVTCGSGFMERRRTCPNVRSNCEGVSVEVHPCHAPHVCLPGNVNWVWTEWSTCHQTCGSGVRLRSKVCLMVGHVSDNQCTPDANVDLDKCDLPPCNLTIEMEAIQQTASIVTAWVIPIVIVTVAFAVFLAVFIYRRKETLRKRNFISNLRRSRKVQNKKLPPLPHCNPEDGYLPMTFVSQTTASNVGATCESRLVDEDGYEIPNDADQTRLPLNPTEDDCASDLDTAVDHVYEQLNFYQDKADCLAAPTDVPEDLEETETEQSLPK